MKSGGPGFNSCSDRSYRRAIWVVFLSINQDILIACKWTLGSEVNDKKSYETFLASITVDNPQTNTSILPTPLYFGQFIWFRRGPDLIQTICKLVEYKISEVTSIQEKAILSFLNSRSLVACLGNRTYFCFHKGEERQPSQMTSRAADFQLNLQLLHDIFYLQNPEKNILQNLCQC